ncbi:MAG: hypothetical protein GWN62_33330 [Aliifodinibius sp.]|nr:hypothetical protein [Fodinibius sp.]
MGTPCFSALIETFVSTTVGGKEVQSVGLDVRLCKISPRRPSITFENAPVKTVAAKLGYLFAKADAIH